MAAIAILLQPAAAHSQAVLSPAPRESSLRTFWVDLANDVRRLPSSASGISIAVGSGTKYAVGRERPDQSSSDSFPSGHAAQSFASAKVIARHFGVGAAWPPFGAATFVSLSRLNQHRHFLSDVVFGAGLGVAVGWTASGHAAAWRLTPSVSRDGELSCCSVEWSW
jgi:membrane-associated phospholipid phosphatase